MSFRPYSPSPAGSIRSYSSSRSFIPEDESRPGSPPTAQCPVMGCTQTVDMIIKSSSDADFLIGGHRADIARFGGSFPQPGINPVVTVTEKSDVLELLMQFMHPQELPDCKDVDFETLLGLALAAKKYGVFSAMVVCKLHFREPRCYEAHPIEVLYYAIQHKYLDIADTVAPLAASKELEEVFNGCSGDLEFFAAWSLYCNAYRPYMEKATQYSTWVIALSCPWGCHSNIGQSVLSVCPWRPTRAAFEEAYNAHTCSNCRSHNNPVIVQVLQLLDTFPRKLSSFLLVKVQTGDHVKFALRGPPSIVHRQEPDSIPGEVVIEEPPSISKKAIGKKKKSKV